ncbi:hypothetical protein MNBD_NITROSPINAE02-2089 [hydrothermal vent metagenome]|uniref:Radical SAM core domain-containing protein n=1 Tax=hydrothermal vent metagenome TaxID=652676 RepID=A0A3B1BSY1_9ZZZZ
MTGLIVSVNRTMSPYPAPPVGAALVADALTRRGAQMKFIDLCFSKNPVADLRRALEPRPDWGGISFRNLDNVSAQKTESYIPYLLEVATVFHEADVPFVLGGTGSMIIPHALKGKTGANGVFIGSSEAFADEVMERGLPEGVVTRRGGELYTVEAVERWIDMERYLKYVRMAPVRFKRGCAYGCSYCAYSSIEGKAISYNDFGDVEKYIAGFLAKGVCIDIVDSLFNEPHDFALYALRRLKEARLEGEYHISALSPRNVSAPLMESMARVGAHSALIGIDSASERMLASYNKPFTMADVDKLMNLRKGAPFRFFWSFVTGGPGETEETIDETLRFIQSLPPTDLAYMTYGVGIYRGTRLFDEAIEEGVIKADDDGLQPRFYFSPQLDREKTLEKLKTAELSIDNLILSASANRRLSHVALKALAGLGAPTHSWETVVTAKRWLRRLGMIRLAFGQ